MKTTEEILKELMGACFNMNVNLNDTFFWACADSEEIDADDIIDLIELSKEYGTYHALVAYCAVKRELMDGDEMPVPIWIKKRQDKKNYLAVKKAIEEEVKSNGEKFVDLSFDYEQQLKEIETYGEKILWTSAKQPSGLVLQVASLPNQKIYAVGSNMHNAMESLKEQLKGASNEKL